LNKGLIDSFGGILKSFNDGATYKKKPPQGPPEHWPSISDEELAALNQTDNGEDKSKDRPYKILDLVLEDDYMPRKVQLPTLDFLADLNIYGIDGSNQKIEKSAFYLILARAAIINFRYSIDGSKPYFTHKVKDSSSVMIVDHNVFDLDKINVNSTIIELGDSPDQKRIGKYLINESAGLLSFRYDISKTDKSPSSQALGIAVKIMQTLELICLMEIPTDKKAICIKDGPLFSTSVAEKDTIEFLSRIHTWNDQILISCSKRTRDSRLLVQALKEKVELRKKWFEKDIIIEKTINQIPSDSLILPRLLKPGERTPLFKAVPVARQPVVAEGSGDPKLTPLTCYYLSRSKPHTYLRLEIPLLFWERDKNRVEDAISVVAWQHELGRIAPLVQVVADERCQLSSEKEILQRQTEAALTSFGLQFLQDY
jgi:hypothetical protein